MGGDCAGKKCCTVTVSTAHLQPASPPMAEAKREAAPATPRTPLLSKPELRTTSTTSTNACPSPPLPSTADDGTVRVRLRVSGMDCAGCASHVDTALSSVRGVRSHSLDPSTATATVDYERGNVTPAELKARIESSTGYKVTETSDAFDDIARNVSREEDVQRLRRLALLAVCIGLPVILVDKLVPPLDRLRLAAGLYTEQLLLLCACVALLIVCARSMYISAYRAARRLTTNLDTLVTIAVSAAVVYSVIAMIEAVARSSPRRPETAFDTVAELIALTFVGRYLEARAGARTSRELEALVRLAPASATVLRKGKEIEMPLRDLIVGDVVVLKPGDRVPADGVVMDGSSSVDESMLTGESLPVAKQSGSPLAAGTQNLDGRLLMMCESVGAATQLGQIVSIMMSAAGGDKARIQLLADKVASYFAPVILTLAGLTLAIWLVFDPTRYIGERREGEGGSQKILLSVQLAISVLVVACPCALTVAIPAATTVGVGVAAKNGVLVRGAAVFERLASITDIVFDKTGTLTSGRLEVQHHANVGTTADSIPWASIVAATRGSRHPASRAVCRYAQHRSREPNEDQSCEVKEIPSQGLIATIVIVGERCSTLLIGNDELLYDAGVKVVQFGETTGADNASARTMTLVHCAADGAHIATFLLSDELKSDAAAAIRHCQRLGYQCHILSGDHHQAVASVGKMVGIDSTQVYSNKSVLEKANCIETIERDFVQAGPETRGLLRRVLFARQPRLRKVLMLGDGINDAPALKVATLGASLASFAAQPGEQEASRGGGSDVAIEAADLILTSKDSHLTAVPIILSLGRAVRRRCLFNLALATIWNAALVPIACGAFLPLGGGIHISPAIAAASMSLSCLTIIASSLWLSRWMPPEPTSAADETTV